MRRSPHRRPPTAPWTEVAWEEGTTTLCTRMTRRTADSTSTEINIVARSCRQLGLSQIYHGLSLAPILEPILAASSIRSIRSIRSIHLLLRHKTTTDLTHPLSFCTDPIQARQLLSSTFWVYTALSEDNTDLCMQYFHVMLLLWKLRNRSCYYWCFWSQLTLAWVLLWPIENPRIRLLGAVMVESSYW